MKILDIFKKPECRVPLCDNPQNTENDWPMCTDCMLNTVKRFLQCEAMMGRLPHDPQYWIDYICENIEEMVQGEQDIIDERGDDYDRDSLT